MTTEAVVAEQATENDVVSKHVGTSATEVGNNNLKAHDDSDDDGDEDEEEQEEEEEEDAEEAEEIARRLKEQLWADINKAQQTAHATAPSAPPAAAVAPATAAARTVVAVSLSGERAALSRKQDAAFQTMKGILAITEHDALAQAILASAVVPGTDSDNVLHVLQQVVRAESISKALAKALAPVLVSLARSDALFATMRHSNAPAMELDKGKRKRDESEEEQRQNDARASKRPHVVYHDFQQQITDAVKIVANTLGARSPPTDDGSLDPSVISSVQLQLHQLFLFSMTSSAGGGPEMNALQEIGGLIQVLGVLSGIQIGPSTTAAAQSHHPPAGSALHSSHPWIPQGTHPNSSAPSNDIGTAVYPCLVPGCRKIFARLFSLRAHQRIHAVHRPFRCAVCPASFARNHDLKRHAKLHEKKAWQCAGCDKMFSRRDAIKRHKNSSATRGGGKGEMCINAGVREVVLDNKEGDEDTVREGRRSRMWADIVAGGAAVYGHVPGMEGGVGSGGGGGGGWSGHLEEGEVHGDVIRETQAAVLSLHATLQGHVSAALGTDHAAPPLHLDPTGGQATLASVIARAQMQNLALASPLVQGQATTTTTMMMVPQVGMGMGMVQRVPGASGDSDDGTRRRPEGSTTLDGRRTSADALDSDIRSVGDGGRSEPAPQLSLYGLSEEQTKLLEQAIANAASAAQAQAEAEAALEEEGEEEEKEEEEEEEEEEDDDDDLDNSKDARVTQGTAPVVVTS